MKKICIQETVTLTIAAIIVVAGIYVSIKGHPLDNEVIVADDTLEILPVK